MRISVWDSARVSHLCQNLLPGYLSFNLSSQRKRLGFLRPPSRRDLRSYYKSRETPISSNGIRSEAGGRVRWWRGSGLRMMPTFPPPPLSFRTAGFPQYGWKVGLSDRAFPRVAQVKPAPSIPHATSRLAPALRALCNSTLRPALSQDRELSGAPPCEELPPLPQRPSLRSGLCCPSPSALNWPHPSHS